MKNLSLSKIKNIRKFLFNMGFKPVNGKAHYFIKIVKGHKVIAIPPLSNPTKKIERYGSIKWGNGVKIGRKTSSDFSNPETLDQLYWFCYLLDCGYDPKNIHIEQKGINQGHRNNKPYYMDIVIYNRIHNKIEPWCVLDAKKRSIYEKTPKNPHKDNTPIGELDNLDNKSQVASYFRFDQDHIKYVGIISTKFSNGAIKPEQHIVSTKGWGDFDNNEWTKPDVDLPLTVSFKFLKNVKPYSTKLPSSLDDLTWISDSPESRRILNKFENIIRVNGISDKANAYNKMLNMLVAKIEDEREAWQQDKGHGKIKFWNYSQDSNETVMDNLMRLYYQGMKNRIKIKIHRNNNIENLIKYIKDNRNNIPKSIMSRLSKELPTIEAHSNAIFPFLFEEVYNKDTYNHNAVVVRKVMDIIEHFRFIDPNKRGFLGGFFESILKNGFEQEYGQFFTPIPISDYIMKSLPLKSILKNCLKQSVSSSNELPRMLDFACGSGHFLTEYMKEMQDQINHLAGLNDAQMDKLKIGSARDDLRRYSKPNYKYNWAEKYVFGIDIDYRLVKTAKVDTFLSGDGKANIVHANALSSLSYLNSNNNVDLLPGYSDDSPRVDKDFDLIISNPPYSVPGFVNSIDLNDYPKLRPYVSKSNQEIQLIFIERSIQLLKDKGYLAIILPSNFLQRSNSKLDRVARQLFLNEFNIRSITFLPGGSFSGAGISTVLLIAQKRNVDFNDLVSQAYDILKESLNCLDGNKRIKDVPFCNNKNILTKYSKCFGFRSIKAYLQQLKFSIKIQQSVTEAISHKNYKSKVIQKYLRQIKEMTNNDSKKVLNHLKNETSKKEIIDITNFFLSDNIIRDNLNIEANKLTTFALNNHDVAVVKPESFNTKSKIQKFLGYKFSGRKGYEGIQPLSPKHEISYWSKLYGSPKKDADYVNRQMYQENDNDNVHIPTSLAKYVRIVKLTELMNFQSSNSYNSIDIMRKNSNIGFTRKSNTIPLSDIANFVPGTSITKANTTRGKYLVVGGGQKSTYNIDHPNREGNTITVSQSGKNAGYIGYYSCKFFASDCFTIKAKPKREQLVKNKFNTKEIYYLLKLKQKDIFKLTSGMAQQHVHINNLLRFEIPCLNKSQHIKLRTRIRNIENKKNAVKNKKNQINKLSRSSLDFL